MYCLISIYAQETRYKGHSFMIVSQPYPPSPRAIVLTFLLTHNFSLLTIPIKTLKNPTLQRSTQLLRHTPSLSSGHVRHQQPQQKRESVRG